MTIPETIAYCRANSKRRNNVLYFAQEQAPLAYAEWFQSSRHSGFLFHFEKFGITKGSYLDMFVEREAQLVELNSMG